MVSKQSNGGADFVAKIKGANDAIGFIATAMKGLDAISVSDNPSEVAKNYNFNGKNILDAQAFDTPVGIIGVNLNLGNLDSTDALFQDKIANAKEVLKNTKLSLSAPMSEMRTKQEESLAAQASNSNPFIGKLNNLLNGLEASANRVGNQIF
jgi:hypothetical protein